MRPSLGEKCLQLHFSCFSHTKGLYFSFLCVMIKGLGTLLRKFKLIAFYLLSEVKKSTPRINNLQIFLSLYYVNEQKDTLYI